MDGFREATLTTTIGRYQILEKVGQGGMGVVYRAHDTLLERVVALKVIAASIDDNPELRERFFREARAAGQLSHPNIITIHDLGEHEGRPYLAMEYLLGEDLQRRLARPDPMSLTRKLEIAAEICEGLSFAHRRGVIHRDIKPANVFITDEGVVKILDFGLARMVASEVTASNMMLGTLNYMAPEQVRGERSDHRADIFSYGVVLYELISGKKAFQGDSYATTLYKILQDVPEPLHALDPTLPSDLVKVVDRSLAKARDERYQDLSDVARDIALVRQHISLSSYVAPATLSGAAAASATTGSFRLAAPGEQSGSSDLTRLQTPVPTTIEPLPPRRIRPAAFAVALLVLIAAIAAWLVLGRSRETAAPDQARNLPPPMVSRPGDPATTPSPAAPPTAAPPAAGTEPPAAPPVVPPAAGRSETPVLPAATPRRTVDDARREMTRAKAAANRAGARARGSASYVAATAAEREGARLLQAGRLAEAAAKFYQASGLFHSAELTPAPQTAPPVTVETPAAPQPAPSGSPAPPPPAPAPPVTGTAPTEPVGQPSTAPSAPPAAAAPKPERAPERAAAPASEPAPPPAEDGVRETIRRYEQALESRSVDAVKRVWPSLGGAQEDALRKEFAYARRIEVDIDGIAVTVTGTTATATFVRRYQLSTDDGQRLNTNSRTTMSLHRTGSDWTIDRIRFEAIR